MERLRPFYTWAMCLMEPYVAPPWVAHHNKVGRQYSRLLQKRAAVIKRPLSNSIRTSANKAQDGDLDRFRLILPKVPSVIGYRAGRILSLTLEEQVLCFLCCWQVSIKRRRRSQPDPVNFGKSAAATLIWEGCFLFLWKNIFCLFSLKYYSWQSQVTREKLQETG